MKNTLLALPALAAVALLAGCAGTNQGAPSAFSTDTSANFTADIEIGGKIEGNATVSKVLGFTIEGTSKIADGVNYGANGAAAGGLLANLGFTPDDGIAAQAKGEAAYDAVTKSGADVIVAPLYTVEWKNYIVYKTATAKVKGFKGTVKSVSQDKVLGVQK